MQIAVGATHALLPNEDKHAEEQFALYDFSNCRPLLAPAISRLAQAIWSQPGHASIRDKGRLDDCAESEITFVILRDAAREILLFEMAVRIIKATVLES